MINNKVTSPLYGKRLKSCERTAFSLVESLVCVLILSVLFLLMAPIVNRMQSLAQAAACLANLEQLGVGIHLYAGDNNGFLPPARDLYEVPQYKIVTWYGDPSSWPYKYINNEWPRGLKIFICPADRTLNKQPRYISYSSNYYYLQDWDGGKPRAQGGYVPIGKAANKILMLDGASLAEGETTATIGRVPEVFLYENMNSVISARHQDGANCLFGSGAVKWMRKSEIITSSFIY